jgi:hypothetical protein
VPQRRGKMTTREFKEWIQELLDEQEEVKQTRTFEEIGYMTRDEGFQVRMENEDIFEITIQKR